MIMIMIMIMIMTIIIIIIIIIAHCWFIYVVLHCRHYALNHSPFQLLVHGLFLGAFQDIVYGATEK